MSGYVWIQPIVRALDKSCVWCIGFLSIIICISVPQVRWILSPSYAQVRYIPTDLQQLFEKDKVTFYYYYDQVQVTMVIMNMIMIVRRWLWWLPWRWRWRCWVIWKGKEKTPFRLIKREGRPRIKKPPLSQWWWSWRSYWWQRSQWWCL